MPVVQPDIPLTRSADGAWSATVADGPAAGLPAHVRLTWPAEVCYPAEPHLPAGATPSESRVHAAAGTRSGPRTAS